MSEADVIKKTHKYLLKTEISGKKVVKLYTDVYHNLSSSGSIFKIINCTRKLPALS